MVRVKRGTISHKRKKKVLQYTKGFRYGRKSKYRLAKEALLHAWTHAFIDRKKRKRDKRRLWTVKINAALREQNLSYSKFIKKLKDNKIELNRKTLSQLAEDYPAIFQKIVQEVSK